MPTSATGTDHRKAGGHTLLELLVVLVLVGLMSGAVLLTQRAPSARLADQADRLAAHLARAREEAVLANRPVAVRITTTGYDFHVSEHGRWRTLQERPFQARQFDADIEAARPGPDRPQRFEFDPTGMAMAGEVWLAQAQSRTRIIVGADGSIHVDATH